MADNAIQAFLQQALGSITSVEQGALENLLFSRLVTSGFAVNGSGVISLTVAPSIPAPVLTTPLLGASGGTGVANTGLTITLGGNFATSGAFGLTLTLTGATNVTLPTSGTLATTAQIPSFPVSPANGGTGIANNNASTITISGSFATTLTVTNTTSVTLPTAGTLATLAGAEELTNKTLTSSVGKGTWTASGTWTLPSLTLSGTVSGTPTWASNQAITLSTAAQGNITSLGTLTGLAMSGKITTYNNVATAGIGPWTTYAAAHLTGQTALVASVTALTVGGADGLFAISANVVCTTSTAHSFTVTCAYTDAQSNSRTLTLGFQRLSGASATFSTFNNSDTTPGHGYPLLLRCKTGTSITVATAGTFTTVTYDIDAAITQIA